jgi:simple sugar transport system permease protein
MFRLEARPQPSRAMSLASPLIALALTVDRGILFVARQDRCAAEHVLRRAADRARLTEVLKATPLVAARSAGGLLPANVWNIGAEGQFLLGAMRRRRRLYVTTHGTAAPQWAMTGRPDGASWRHGLGVDHRAAAAASTPARSWSA